MITPIGINSSIQHVSAPQRSQNNMPFRKIFLATIGALTLSCAPFCANSASPTQTARVSPQTTVQKLPPARLKATLDDYHRWLNT
ncbi:MAG: serine hydrolase, partial [Rhodanobacter sp.]